MATPPKLASIGVLAALAITLAACTAQPDPQPALPTTPIVQLGAPGEPNRTLSPDEALALASETVDYVEEDVLFVRDMLHHHSQAIVMTDYVDELSEDEDVRLLAERMSISQTDEMALLEKWLQDRGEPVRDPDAGHDAHSAASMPGLLTDEELAQLAAARGDSFDRLFLTLMIRHHEGAIQMVQELFAANGGQEMEIGQIAIHIEGDQDIEIKRMAGMLDEMP